MEKTSILVTGRDEEILATMLRIISRNPKWIAAGAMTDEEAEQLFIAQPFDLVMMTNGIDAASEARLKKFFASHNPQVPVIQHYGGGSGLLQCEIKQAIEKREYIS